MINIHRQLEQQNNVLIWLPFPTGETLSLSPQVALTGGVGRSLPVFLEGVRYNRWRKTSRVAIDAHSVLAGAFLGYQQLLPTCTDAESERAFLADTIRIIADGISGRGLAGTLIGMPHWLRMNVGLRQGRLAMRTSVVLDPGNMSLRCDYLVMTWMLAEQTEGDEQQDLLADAIAWYHTLNLDGREATRERMSFIFCAALGCAGRHLRVEDADWFAAALRDVRTPMLRERLLTGMRAGFTMDGCRLLMGN